MHHQLWTINGISPRVDDQVRRPKRHVIHLGLKTIDGWIPVPFRAASTVYVLSKRVSREAIS